MKHVNDAMDILAYEVPQVEIIEVTVEKGFAGSATGEVDPWE